MLCIILGSFAHFKIGKRLYNILPQIRPMKIPESTNRLKTLAVIFLPARPASQTHDSHKGRMILNHVNPAGRIKNCGEKSAFKNLQLSFWTFFYLRTVSWIILVKTGTEILPNSLAIITSLGKHVFSDIHGEFTGKSQCR